MSAVVTANHGPALSPVDEWVYVDYLLVEFALWQALRRQNLSRRTNHLTLV